MSLAIAYGMKKKAKKMAEGGEAGDGSHRRNNEKGVHTSGSGGLHESTAGSLAKVGTSLHRKGDRARVYGEAHAGEGALNKSKELHREKLDEMKSMKKPNLYAEGGDVCECGTPGCPRCDDDAASKPTAISGGYAEGGEVDDDDLVGRIMKRRMSEGGKVANETPETADFDDNEFDDLVLRDDLEEHYTGKNSGDEIGDKAVEDEDDDIVSRAMRSRSKKDKLPRPA
jgi:hypothetical protein